ncbi:MAG TPA: signal peptide peptidase SppA [Candidatus Binataceae bacterium]|nr:signal peptide peptidase SppA [Candidatus Binataceae bacterium]
MIIGLERMMKLARLRQIRLSREARLAILVAVLIALGVISLDAGWHLVGAVLLLIAAGVVTAFYLLVLRPARIPENSVLMLKIADGLREEPPRSPIEQLRSRGTPTLYDLRRVLECAAGDPSIKTVVVELNAPAIGLATAQELYDRLRSIVAAGKHVIALLAGDNVSVRDYLVACAASEIVVNPDSSFMMLGVAAGNFFLRSALGKLGVEVQTLQWKEYKGAAEMFSREGMSPELRESLEAIINDWKAILVEHVAAARKLTPEVAKELLARGFVGARTACETHLADRTGYIEDIRTELDPKNEDGCFIAMPRYLRRISYLARGGDRARLALIHGVGPVIAGEPPMAGEFISGERTAAEIRRAAHDDQVRAIVFRVNSPGGSAVGSDLVWRAVREAQKRGKPVVVSMGDVAGSGGYYVAMSADAIVAEPGTITGSIGVVYAKLSVRDLLAQAGIAIDVAKTDPIADALSFARPMTEAELAQLNQVVGELYGNFTAKVAEGRKLSADAAEAVARGRVWSGVAAKAHGLVDELGGLDCAVAIARIKAGIADNTPHELVPYPPTGMMAALSASGVFAAEPSWPFGLGARLTGLPPRWMPALIHLLARGGLMMICPVIK